jgi:hypothetical protein
METSTTDFIKWFTAMGIGGVLAGFMFMFYRKDIKQYTELWKSTTDQLIILVKEDVTSNVKLVAMLESWERNNRRKEDIEHESRDRK